MGLEEDGMAPMQPGPGWDSCSKKVPLGWSFAIGLVNGTRRDTPFRRVRLNVLELT